MCDTGDAVHVEKTWSVPAYIWHIYVHIISIRDGGYPNVRESNRVTTYTRKKYTIYIYSTPERPSSIPDWVKTLIFQRLTSIHPDKRTSVYSSVKRATLKPSDVLR